ncbi:MAG TPA: DNA polymerase III subunit delta' [Pirellulaceae bacterium]|nr:DNA polymerase III subunit delta' [Pirellulaceae bacterium]HMO93211.1 DNA polymerase III subunit delta' [Pirellulaceae bacterium]HMP70042.1 DNA polymerase III subunit delta' [Pirellulaceae bacterium]
MYWKNCVGFEQQIDKFRTAIRANRLASTYLFVGPSGIGKRHFAKTLAKALLCSRNPEADLMPCNECPDCVQFDGGLHPDLHVVSKPVEKAYIPVELFIGSSSKRMREGLCHDFSRKSYRGKRKIGIIEDADYFNDEGANAILKLLEEPPPRSLLMLLGTSATRQLPTIRSRSQIITFRPLLPEQIEQIVNLPHVVQKLIESGLIDNEQALNEIDVRPLARMAHGNMENVIQLLDPAVREFHEQFVTQLSSFDPSQDDFTKTTESFIDEVGKENALRRLRFSNLCDTAINFYRGKMLECATNDADLAVRFADCIERCMEAQSHAAANMNLANLIEIWLVDLGKISRGEITRGIAKIGV